MSVNGKQYYCKTCGRTMDENQFYTSRRADRYPDGGKLAECKKCITRHVNNWDPETYKWILEEIDVPYIEEEWNKLLGKYGKDRSKLTGMTILGRYLSKMKLNQYANYHWEDSERLKEEADAHKRDIMARQGYTGEEIEQAIAENRTPEEPPKVEISAAEEPAPIDAFEPVGFEDNLTEEDKLYLSIKWGRTYKPYEWVQLEKYYQDMMSAFDIQTPSHEDYLKLICKTSLKAHQLIDLGDIEGFQKMSKVYDILMKSAKFTAVQNKEESGEFVNSISEFVLLCEKEGGFIPRFYIDKPQDQADKTLEDMRGYLQTLVTEEMNLGTLIESAVKALQRQSEIEEDEDPGDDEEDLSMEELNELKDSDFEEHYDFVEGEALDDEEMIRQITEEVDK